MDIENIINKIEDNDLEYIYGIDICDILHKHDISCKYKHNIVDKIAKIKNMTSNYVAGVYFENVYGESDMAYEYLSRSYNQGNKCIVCKLASYWLFIFGCTDVSIKFYNEAIDLYNKDMISDDCYYAALLGLFLAYKKNINIEQSYKYLKLYIDSGDTNNIDVYNDEIGSSSCFVRGQLVHLITYMLKILYDNENEVLTDDIYKFILNEDILPSYIIHIIKLINDKSLDKIHKYYVPQNGGYMVAKEHFVNLSDKK